jgi:hypothetical protein
MNRCGSGHAKPVRELGEKMTVLVTKGEGHFPLSRKNPKPVVDFILGHQQQMDDQDLEARRRYGPIHARFDFESATLLAGVAGVAAG